MAYISISKIILEQEFPFLVILIAYIIRSCDPTERVNTGGVSMEHQYY